jgi:hypothetical protein
MTPGELRMSLSPAEAIARVRERYFGAESYPMVRAS